MAYLGDSSLCKDGISPWAGNFPYKNKNPSALLPFPPPNGLSVIATGTQAMLLPAQLKQIYGCEFSTDFNLRMSL